jgi:hypothetical protein
MRVVLPPAERGAKQNGCEIYILQDANAEVFQA